MVGAIEMKESHSSRLHKMIHSKADKPPPVVISLITPICHWIGDSIGVAFITFRQEVCIRWHPVENESSRWHNNWRRFELGSNVGGSLCFF